MGARYRFTIDTSEYHCARCSKKNWEYGTRNDYMLAINGRTGIEHNLREVRWLLDLFQNNLWPASEWDPSIGEHGDFSKRYTDWVARKCHNVTYHDRLCGFDRHQVLSGYGWMQGYFDKRKVIEELRTKGSTKVPFSWLYDARQYDKDMDGCYMLIEKIC